MISSITADDDFDAPFEIEVTLGGAHRVSFPALVDSGCSIIGVIDQQLAYEIQQQLGRSMIIPLVRPRPTVDFKKRQAGMIREKMIVPMTIASHTESAMTFYLSDLGAPTAIIGRPWLRRHGVSVQFNSSIADALVFNNACSHDLSVTEVTSVLPPMRIRHQQDTETLDPDVTRTGKAMDSPAQQPKRLLTAGEDKPIKTESSAGRLVPCSSTPEANAKGTDGQRREKRRLQELAKRHRQYAATAAISAVSAPAFAQLGRQEGHEVFAISLQDITEELKKRDAAKTAAEQIDELLPAHLHGFKDVFDRERSNRLPPHRRWDHKIELQDNKLPRTEPLRRLAPEGTDRAEEVSGREPPKRMDNPEHSLFCLTYPLRP